MFGRKQKPPTPPQDVIREAREAVKDAALDWEETLKRPYQAAGMDLTAALAHVEALENKASGSSGHPWPPQVKLDMVKRMNGASTLPEANRQAGAVQLDYEQALTAELERELQEGDDA